MMQKVNRKSPAHAKAKRRGFTTEFKLRILEEYDRAEPGHKTLILRREGLYSSHIHDWRKWRENFEQGRVVMPKKPQTPTALRRENERLRRENERLQHKLKQANFLIEVQKKLQQTMEELNDENTP